LERRLLLLLLLLGGSSTERLRQLLPQPMVLLCQLCRVHTHRIVLGLQLRKLLLQLEHPGRQLVAILVHTPATATPLMLLLLPQQL